MGLLRARYQIKSLLSHRIGSIVVLEVERLLLFFFFLFYYSWWLVCDIQQHDSSFSSYRWAASLCASLTIFICPSASIVFALSPCCCSRCDCICGSVFVSLQIEINSMMNHHCKSPYLSLWCSCLFLSGTMHSLLWFFPCGNGDWCSVL